MPPYAPPSAERKTSVCCGCARPAAVPAAAYARASSISAAVPEALSFAPGPRVVVSRCAITATTSRDRPGIDSGDVRERRAPEVRDVLLPPVDVDVEPVEGELPLHPAGGGVCAGAARLTPRMAAGELRRQCQRRLRVEDRRQCRRRQRAWARDRERQESDGDDEDERRDASKARVQGSRSRAAARPLTHGARPGRLHGAGYSRSPQPTRAERAKAVGMQDSSTILLVDDEDSIQTLLTYPLERDGYRVVQARDGEEALRRFDEEPFDLVVLDVMLPRVDGLEVCRRLRAESTVPIIMLTARDDELDKVLGLELGADDYITKPFSIREFRSRVRALLRRAATPHVSSRREEVIERGDVRIDLLRRTVEVRNEPVRLTFVEFELLALLASQPGVVFSRRQLLERLRGGSDYREPRTIDVHVRHLREKIEREPATPELIRTVRGVGYRFGEG